ncbi:hypothetical protein NMG60_11037355 [Bertholletia excelsa]
MASIQTISAALKLVHSKKENLRKAFDDLQAHSSSFSSFNLKWSDLDSYFSSIQDSLERKFEVLQSQQSQQKQEQQYQCQSSNPQPQSSVPPGVVNGFADLASMPARPELKSFCENMDGLGLRNYVVERPKERAAIRAELADALGCAPDAPAMVLDAMEGFFVPNSKGDRDIPLSNLRRGCVVLLEHLMGMRPEIGAQVKERAGRLAREWKDKVSVNGENPLEALGFLILLAAYGLADEFQAEELIDLAVVVAQHKQAIELCRVLNFGDRISDIVLKLLNQGKKLVAVKFITRFGLTDKFPPVPLLKEHVKESKKLAKKVRQSGNNSRASLNEATAKEVSALRSVIKIIEDHNLESVYPKDILVNRVEKLEKEKAERKGPAAASASKISQKSMPKKQKVVGQKRPRTSAAAGPAKIPKSVAAAASLAVPAFQQSHPPAAGLLPERPSSYLSSPAGPYGLAGSTAVAQYAGSGPSGLNPAAAQYAGPSGSMPAVAQSAGPSGSIPAVAQYAAPSTGLYMPVGGSLGMPGNLMPPQSHVYPSESSMPSVYPDRPVTYGGYALGSHYHPTYYPK